jgi:hypothetical protein
MGKFNTGARVELWHSKELSRTRLQRFKKRPHAEWPQAVVPSGKA